MNTFKNQTKREWFNAFETHYTNLKALQQWDPTFAAQKTILI